MWEVFTCGSHPYGRLKNHEVAELVNQGKTLEKPDNCPTFVYKVMKHCWTLVSRGPRGVSRNDLNQIVLFGKITEGENSSGIFV